jgi:hypothetical protein
MYVVEGDASTDDDKEEVNEPDDTIEDVIEKDILVDEPNKDEENQEKNNEESKEDILTCNFSGEFA